MPVALLHEAMLNALDQPAAPAATAARPNLAPALGGKRILIVDDNDFHRQVGRELVELTGATVDTANDGAQAVAAVPCWTTTPFEVAEAFACTST